MPSLPRLGANLEGSMISVQSILLVSWTPKSQSEYNEILLNSGFRFLFITINHRIQPLINQLNAILGASKCCQHLLFRIAFNHHTHMINSDVLKHHGLHHSLATTSQQDIWAWCVVKTQEGPEGLGHVQSKTMHIWDLNSTEDKP